MTFISAKRLLFALIVLLTVPSSGWADGPLIFGVVASDTAETSKLLWQPLADGLSRQLGMDVQLKTTPDYSGVIRGMQNGQIDIAELGNESAIKAVDYAGAEIFAKFVLPSGKPEYYSLLIANSKLPLYTEMDVFKKAADLKLALGDVNSTSGSLVPTYFLFHKNKINSGKAFKSAVRANHEENVLAVSSGRVDVAAVASYIYDRMCKENPEIETRTRVVWESPPIPSNPLLLSPNVPAAIRAKISDFILAYGQERAGKPSKTVAEEKAALSRLAILRFVASDNSQLQAIRLIEALRSSPDE